MPGEQITNAEIVDDILTREEADRLVFDARADILPVIQMIEAERAVPTVEIEPKAPTKTVSKRFRRMIGVTYKPEQSNCSDLNAEIFHPEVPGKDDPKEMIDEYEAAVRKAKEYCNSCVAQTACLDYAINNKEKSGIWGGLTEKERTNKVRSRARAAKANKAA